MKKIVFKSKKITSVAIVDDVTFTHLLRCVFQKLEAAGELIIKTDKKSCMIVKNYLVFLEIFKPQTEIEYCHNFRVTLPEWNSE